MEGTQENVQVNKIVKEISKIIDEGSSQRHSIKVKGAVISIKIPVFKWKEEKVCVNYPRMNSWASCESSELYPKIGLGALVLPLAVCRRLPRNSW